LEPGFKGEMLCEGYRVIGLWELDLFFYEVLGCADDV
jgi:hypothetical protein